MWFWGFIPNYDKYNARWVDLLELRLKVSIHGPVGELVCDLPVSAAFHGYFGDSSGILNCLNFKMNTLFSC